jgi:hypothetical protein
VLCENHSDGEARLADADERATGESGAFPFGDDALQEQQLRNLTGILSFEAT